ncbi:MAG: LysR family transcriptional regulator [Candidatus Marithrix sp.]|nr:LysR family transcriptional regulator [Candidatus Marithrix sp.]
MNMTLRQLTLFQAVAQHLSFTRAAIELSLTQPAVSIQIKQLEGHVGIELFEQIGKKIFLTEAGHKLYAACDDIFERLNLLETSLNELQGSIKGQLKISVVTTATYFIPKIFQAFSKIYPEVNLRLQVYNRVKVLERLTNNQDDLVIMGQVPEHLNVTAHAFLDNPLVVIASSQHQLANQADIPLSRLLQENVLMREVGSGTRLAIEKNFAINNLEICTQTELGSTEAIKQGVLANMGISMLSKHAISLELASQKMAILDVNTFPLKKSWYVTHLTEKKLPLVAQTFLDFLLTKSQKVIG